MPNEKGMWEELAQIKSELTALRNKEDQRYRRAVMTIADAIQSEERRYDQDKANLRQRAEELWLNGFENPLWFAQTWDEQIRNELYEKYSETTEASQRLTERCRELESQVASQNLWLKRTIGGFAVLIAILLLRNC